ncbi:MAG TPA: hypothetical protein DCQ06_12740 [Myxococcales bacterium]|nr:hypothetical protein [Myxococcales bacterium]HAN32455.1 hypothetical protein [Myxococcales bacterium]
MKRLGLRLFVVALCSSWASVSWAGLGDTLPRGTFLLDSSYIFAHTNKQFDRNGKSVPLLAPVERYEAGAGLQGVIRANPSVDQKIVALQLLYGITDDLTLAIGGPLSLSTEIETNLSWQPGDYQASLGRPYSETDFWQWAASMGQPKPAQRGVSNVNTWGDLVVAFRLRLPRSQWMKDHHVNLALTLQGALPTGREKDPEELIEIGMTAWWLHNYGDLELHLAADWRPIWSGDVARLTLSAEIYYAYLRPRTYDTPRGTKHPLLLTFAPYVGQTFEIDGGDWQVARMQVEWAPFIGPTLGTWMTRGSVEAANAFPPMLSLMLQYTYVNLLPSIWKSNYPIWSIEQGEFWGAGFKHIFAAQATLSLLRVGAPLMFYVRGRALDIIPGRNMRPANAITVGVRLLAKFW